VTRNLIKKASEEEEGDDIDKIYIYNIALEGWRNLAVTSVG